MQVLKVVGCLSLLFAHIVSFGQGAEAQLDRKCLPFFGDQKKTSKQMDEELRFLSDCDKAFSSREEAGKFFLARGWEYLSEGQLDTAAYRFNLGYLLDSKNVEVYWGLGVVSFQRLKFDESKQILRMGVDLSPDNVPLLVDLATVEIKSFEQTKKPEDLNEAIKILNYAKELDSTYAQTYYALSNVDYYKEDYVKSWENLHQGRTRNFSLINLQFVQELSAKLPDPTGFFKNN